MRQKVTAERLRDWAQECAELTSKNGVFARKNIRNEVAPDIYTAAQKTGLLEMPKRGTWRWTGPDPTIVTGEVIYREYRTRKTAQVKKEKAKRGKTKTAKTNGQKAPNKPETINGKIDQLTREVADLDYRLACLEHLVG